MRDNDEQRLAELEAGRKQVARNQRADQLITWEYQGVLQISVMPNDNIIEYRVGGELIATKIWGEPISEELLAQIALAIAVLPHAKPRTVQSTERDHSYREQHITPSLWARYGKEMESK